MKTGNEGKELTPASPSAVPPWWTSEEEAIQSFLTAAVRRGAVSTLAQSPGGRAVRMVAYGAPEPERRGTANFNSAMGAAMPDAYYRRGERIRPVLVVLAGVHGQEVEGMMGALSLIRILETGSDLAGRAHPALREKMERLRLLVIPLANPDGRARVPYGGWIGLPVGEMTKYGQGTRKNGEPYGWMPSKANHPMKGDVGLLGGYFDDAGVNMMHDEWSSPMSRTTAALLKLVREEGPDMLMNLHSHEYPPEVLQTSYIPVEHKEGIADFAARYYRALERNGITPGAMPPVREDRSDGACPPAFNLQSLIYHVGAGFGFTFESPHGVLCGCNANAYRYEDLLTIHHALFECAADWLLGN